MNHKFKINDLVTYRSSIKSFNLNLLPERFCLGIITAISHISDSKNPIRYEVRWLIHCSKVGQTFCNYTTNDLQRID